MHRQTELYLKYRDFILLTEIGAFLHDIGKLSKFFILSKAKDTHIKDFHGQILFLDYKKIPERVKEFLFSPLTEHLNEKSIKGIDLSISLSHFACAHHGCARCLKGSKCQFKDVIQKHPLIALLKTVDHLDASNPSNTGKQPKEKTTRDNFFFPETEIPVNDLNEMRFSFYNELDLFLKNENSIEKINKFVKSLGEKYFANALSETRRYGNDITLLDHSKAVAAYYKTYLFRYLALGKPLPNSFFEAHFKLLGIKGDTEKAEQFLSYGIACCNSVLSDGNKAFFLAFPARQNSQFAKFLKSKFNMEIYGLDDFSPLFYDTHGKRALEKFKSLIIKDPSGIKEGYTEKDAISDIKKVVLFAEFRRKEQFSAKLKSIERHLSNLKMGTMHDTANFAKYFKKEKEALLLKKRINAGASTEKIREMYGWKNSKDGEKEIYDFFNTILSPVRPPSPLEMSDYFLREYNKCHSYKKLYERFILKRPFVLGRVYALLRTLQIYKGKPI
jgi:hypothetical protein